jgi:hypothetical protein
VPAAPYWVTGSRLLDDSGRPGIWPDAVQVPGGLALIWAAHPVFRVWLNSGLHPAGCRDEAWHKKGLPCS